ncbi:MAG: NADH-quinone oxidoreductase subunit J [Acidimicrobiia bacterium]|nr:NADH-quinone oxidoreductase subunit J [Acidimicrobiia bacterium]MBT8249906.1 NADH-quinone oxidoreductase subunit J [Acidimicrobiia bacterium]NNC42134.1 NADH-quinone oxidoreductase subunit J [Acidimicrobiia bacterium]NND13966.1 NADH-quinone oxidoreductase subunit J [Acidimicrobiia bacterium]NNL28075.1 NADH-quinone oxidoreductase subunit J [Acidimicrobiia bacterium]
MTELILFVLFGVGALAGAIMMVASRNPVYSALGLIGTMFSIAVLYVVNGAHFVAAVQIVVYAGAVMTLFLFVIMLIGVDQPEDTTEQLPIQRPAALALGAILLIGFVVVIAAGTLAGSDDGTVVGTVEAIADELFTNWLLPFEVTTLLLVIASVGAIVLAQFKLRDRK